MKICVRWILSPPSSYLGRERKTIVFNGLDDGGRGKRNKRGSIPSGSLIFLPDTPLRARHEGSGEISFETPIPPRILFRGIPTETDIEERGTGERGDFPHAGGIPSCVISRASR